MSNEKETDLGSAHSMHAYRILLVEDEIHTCRLLESQLLSALPAARVDTAPTVIDADRLLSVSITEGIPYHVAIVDSRLPPTFGHAPEVAFALCLRILEECPNTYIIHTSRFAEEAQRYWGLQHKAERPRRFLIVKDDGWSERIIDTVRALSHEELLISFPAKRALIDVTTGIQNIFDEKNLTTNMLCNLSHRAFEELIAEIWGGLGYDVELTKRTRDGGRDIIAARDNETEVRFLIECKRFSPDHKVDVALVRSLYGVKMHEKATKAILATTSTFTKPASEFFEMHRWELEARDSDGILDWIRLVQRKAR